LRLRWLALDDGLVADHLRLVLVLEEGRHALVVVGARVVGTGASMCPHRTQRPWSGQQEKPVKNELPDFDPTNPLCPGVTRPNGIVYLKDHILISQYSNYYVP